MRTVEVLGAPAFIAIMVLLWGMQYLLFKLRIKKVGELLCPDCGYRGLAEIKLKQIINWTAVCPKCGGEFEILDKYKVEGE